MKTPQRRLIDTPTTTLRAPKARRAAPFPGGRNAAGQLHHGLPQTFAGKPVVLSEHLTK